MVRFHFSLYFTGDTNDPTMMTTMDNEQKRQRNREREGGGETEERESGGGEKQRRGREMEGVRYGGREIQLYKHREVKKNKRGRE